MIAELCALRADPTTHSRPIVFVCHGFGGLLVERALVLSSTKRSRRVGHLRSIFLSTYAVMYMGTPHQGIQKESLLFPAPEKDPGPSQFMISLLEGSEIITETEDLFALIRQEFCIFNFWEETETTYGSLKTYIVGKGSAAPPWSNVEQCGLLGTHSDMVKMGSPEDPNYQIVQEAIERYARLAVKHIQMRWHHDSHESKGTEEDEIQRKLSLEDVPTNDAFAINENKWFLVDRSPTTYFTGRESHARTVKHRFSEAQMQLGRKTHAIFVVCGLGGSGKTQFSLKYVHDNRSRCVKIIIDVQPLLMRHNSQILGHILDRRQHCR